MVEGVKGFEPQLDVLRLGKMNILLEGHVPEVEAGAIERIAIGVAHGPGGGGRKRCRIEPLVDRPIR